MARYSASQHLRFRIKELWETKGSKKDFEDFYQEKMDEFRSAIEQEVYDIQHGSVSMDEKIKKIGEIFGIDRKQQYPLDPVCKDCQSIISEEKGGCECGRYQI